MNILIIYLKQKKFLDTNPFDFSGTKWWHFLITLGLGGIVLIFGLNSSRWFSLPVTTNTNSLNTLLAYSNGKLYLKVFLLSNVLLGPIREEFFHRMLLMETYFKASPYYLDVLISASMFAASHILPGGNFQTFGIYAIPGALYALTYRLTRNIY
ncbi:lysostaphin resistance A-like protein [Streptococcus pluranimalium]